MITEKQNKNKCTKKNYKDICVNMEDAGQGLFICQNKKCIGKKKISIL